jgi:CMP-N,N'-diacetyllegionaminic acid synthase
MKNKNKFPKSSITIKKTFLAVIPARGNSQRIKNKNLFKLNNKPLIYWTINSAVKSKYISSVCVTSDSNQILNYCKKLNVKTILRPKKLSGNIIMPDEAIKHAYLKLKKKYDFIVMLQPTSPLRTSEDIDNAIEIIIKDKSESLFSSSVETGFIWKKSKNSYRPINYNFKKRPRSQGNQDISFYIENGAIYITKSNLFAKSSNRLGGKISTYNMPYDRSVDIDSIQDFKEAEKILNSQNKK